MDGDPRFETNLRLNAINGFLHEMNDPVRREKLLLKLSDKNSRNAFEISNNLPTGSIQAIQMFNDSKVQTRVKSLRSDLAKAIKIESESERGEAIRGVVATCETFNKGLAELYPEAIQFTSEYRKLLIQANPNQENGLFKFVDQCDDNSFVLIPLIVIAIIAIFLIVI